MVVCARIHGKYAATGFLNGSKSPIPNRFFICRKKIIIWCANIHTFSAAYNKEYLPLGTYIKKKYGHQAYMLDFGSYGRENDAGQIVGNPVNWPLKIYSIKQGYLISFWIYGDS
ncbi:hypothetical protein KUH03_07660 [Sphingobacterium sp. E70]|uniref:hypothetical protein n=1 Tax=Sphingobacterium sp. E70 TaxID=2853439 RepID=UPI00211C130C|nr:hypothetical protein [Sphingobacterium sp. E70]ULT26700.1 hypothetical protein KUH03_07660 [Sphingobacterium sp. E70]